MGDANDEDRISKLPNGVIHHMMSFLPTKDVVRTCLLSKRWKLIWYSVPALSFSDHIEVEGRQEFYNYIEKYLEHRKRGMYFMVDSVITSFKLNMLNYWHCKCEKSKADDILDKWLAFIVLNKVEEIYLSIWPKQHWIFEESYYYFCYYCLPKIWFENATYLTVLELEYVELDASCSFSFQPSLEALICNIPLLENLNLSYYPSPLDYRLRISSQHLKSFTFEFLSGGLIHVEIESAPKLEYFCYKGDVNFSISMESSNSINGKIVIHEKEELDYDRKWFTDLIIFLANLNCSWNIVTLHVSTYKALIWPENLKNICRSSLLNWKHLRVITDCLPEKESELKEALMWISPSLDSLSINENVIF